MELTYRKTISHEHTREQVKGASCAKGEAELQSSCNKDLSRRYRKFRSWMALPSHPHISQSLDVAWPSGDIAPFISELLTNISKASLPEGVTWADHRGIHYKY